MPFTVSMPKLSPTMVEGTIAKWHKKEGEFIAAGDLLLEIGTDKATIEYNVLDGGYVRKLLHKEGDKVAVGEPVAVFTETDSESIEGYAPKQQKEAEQPKAPAKQAPRAEERPVAMSMEGKERVLASPYARHLAKERGIPLDQVHGSGPHGRILSRDLPEAAVTPAFPAIATAGAAFEEIPMTPMLATIAERLSYSKAQIPHFYIGIDVYADAIVALKEESKRLELNFTINDYIIKAVACTLMLHKSVNSSYDAKAKKIRVYPHADVCVAVTVQGGLYTPILRAAETKSLQQLSTEMKRLAARAREGKLQPSEYLEGTFTISNLGMYGIPEFYPIINPPQAAILGVGAIEEKAVAINGQIMPKKVLHLTLSCDHRIVNGIDAAQFLSTLKAHLENPLKFLAV